MEEIDDDLPLDALVKKFHSENNNGNNEKVQILTDPDGPPQGNKNVEVDEADEVSISSDSATTKSEDAQTLLQVNFTVNSLFMNSQKLILSFCELV